MKNLVQFWIITVLCCGFATLPARAQSPRLDPAFAVTSATDTAGRAIFFDMALQADGKIIVSGLFNSINGHPAASVARLLPDGQVDTTFSAPPVNAVVRSVAVQADGKVLIGGDFTTVGRDSCIGIARLLANGLRDPGFRSPLGIRPSFGSYVSSNVTKIVVQPGKGVLALGFLIPLTGPGVSYVVRLLEAAGARDTTFRLPANLARTIMNDALVLPGGHLVFAGRPTLFNGGPCTVWGMLPDGALDPTFVPLPGINSFSWAYGLAHDPSTGKLYVVRKGRVLNLEPVRLLPNGTPDPTFGIAAASFPQSFGGASSMAVQPNGRLLLCGGFYVAGGYYLSARLLPSGALDPSYDPSLGPSQGDGAKVLVQPDGKLLFAGSFIQAGGFALNALARMLDPNVLSARAPGQPNDVDALDAWPVPARDVLHLRLPAGRVARHLALRDARGRVVVRQAVPAGQAAPVLPTAGLPPGGYLLRVDFAAGPPAYRRVVVE